MIKKIDRMILIGINGFYVLTLRMKISTPADVLQAKSAVGQKRRFGAAPAVSALRSIAGAEAAADHGREGPHSASCNSDRAERATSDSSLAWPTALL
jgi:hypothetical protein